MNKIEFKKSLRGYDCGQVDRFVENMTAEYQSGCDQNEILERENRRLSALVAEQSKSILEWETAYKQLKQETETLSAANQTADILYAQKQAAGQAVVEAELFAASKVEAAKAEAEQILGKSRREAERILEKAKVQYEEMTAKRGHILRELEDSLQAMLGEEPKQPAKEPVYDLYPPIKIASE